MERIIVVATEEQIAGLLNGELAYSPVESPAAPALVIPTPPADGVSVGKSLTPLFKVSYTSKAGKTATYGVVWNGYKDGEHRLGLRKLTADGRRLQKFNRFAKNFFVSAAACRRVA
jgi:hypothetical protein